MEIKSYDLESYRLHLIKSKKSKSCHMEIHFRDKVDKSNIHYKSFLCDILTDCSLKYDTRKSVVIKLEDLYKSSFYGTTSKTGGVINTIFVYDFLAPKYIDDKNYLNDTLNLPFEMILNPKVINKEFDSKVFEVVKERMQRDIDNIYETPPKLSIHNALNVMDKDSLTSVSILGSSETLEEVTPKSLYKEYVKMIESNYCDVFVIGDIDFEDTYEIIKSKFKLNTIKTKKLDLYVDNKCTHKIKEASDDSKFVQSNISIICNLKDLTKHEKTIDIQIFNYLLGSGGLTSKLYKKVREENSLCYGIYSMFIKYDNILIIQVAVDKENKEKTVKLIKECLKEMSSGKFTDEEFTDAVNNILLSLEMTLDNNIAALGNYTFGIYDNLPAVEERMKLFKKATKEDVIKVAKKVKINTIYTLRGKHE